MGSTVIEQISEVCHKCHSHLITPNQATEQAGTIAVRAIQEISEGKHEAQTKLRAFHSSMKEYFDLNTKLMAAVEKFIDTQEEEAYNIMHEILDISQSEASILKSKYRL